MRAASEHPHKLSDGSMGWFHDVGDAPRQLPKPPPDVPMIDCNAIMERWWTDGYSPRVNALAMKLGVSYESLCRLQCAWAPPYSAWAFPMRAGNGAIIGIRLRDWNGKKWAVRGSHQGLFIPAGNPGRTALICEGPSDSAAALDLGMFPLGRPSCAGCIEAMAEAIHRLSITRAIIMCDNDEPGLRGGETLGLHLPVAFCTLVLPTKDLREFLNEGGTKEVMASIMRNVIWSRPCVEQGRGLKQ